MLHYSDFLVGFVVIFHGSGILKIDYVYVCDVWYCQITHNIDWCCRHIQVTPFRIDVVDCLVMIELCCGEHWTVQIYILNCRRNSFGHDGGDLYGLTTHYVEVEVDCFGRRLQGLSLKALPVTLG